MRFPAECTVIYPSNPCPWRTHLISGPAVRRRDPTCGSLDARVPHAPEQRSPTQALSVCEEVEEEEEEEEETAEDEVDFEGICFFFW